MRVKNKIPHKKIEEIYKNLIELKRQVDAGGKVTHYDLRFTLEGRLVYGLCPSRTFEETLWVNFVSKCFKDGKTLASEEEVWYPHYKSKAIYKKENFKPLGEEEMATKKEALSRINELYAEWGMESYDALATTAAEADTILIEKGNIIKELTNDVNDLTNQTETLKAALRKAGPASASKPTKVKADGPIPSGSMVFKKFSELFPKVSHSKDFDVPCWEWDGDHPEVPEVDSNYKFRKESLLTVLSSLMSNEPCYIHGHTGSGKTTLVSQVAAHLNWPFIRFNFDSEVSRMDLIGRETLTSDTASDGSKVTVSKFVEGFLPQALKGPYMACFDEVDFIRPDVAYVMQRVFEGEGLVIAEDGGRLVEPNPSFRMFATGNTVGQGDEYGMYQGARPQSMAMLDRFTKWTHVPYLGDEERKSLITSTAPILNSKTIDSLNQYVKEHLKAFVESRVHQSISPRGFLSIAKSVQSKAEMYDEPESTLLKYALTESVLDKASKNDKAVLSELVNRCV